MKHKLEILNFPALKPHRSPPLLFIHGAFTGAWFWEYFLRRCSTEGFNCSALSLRGHGGSGGREKLDTFGINDFEEDLAETISAMQEPPVIIAHSMGGFVAQRFIARGGKASGIALMASVAPYGSFLSGWHMSIMHGRLMYYLLRYQLGLMNSPDISALRELLFSPDMKDDDLLRFARMSQKESFFALTEMMLPGPWKINNAYQIPALVLGAENDKLIHHLDVAATAAAFRVSAEFIPDTGHALVVDTGSERVLDRLLYWLNEQWP